MKKIVNISLYVVLFLVIVSICILSIKKFFDNKEHKRLDNIIATNFVVDFVSFNKIENEEKENISLELETFLENKESDHKEEIKVNSDILEKTTEEEKEIEEVKQTEEIKNENIVDEYIIYDNLKEEELVLRLDSSLKNELNGMGIYFVNYYKKTGLDPYLSAAIVLHETGCTWNCSKLVKECFNYGGMKGGEKKYNDTNYTCYNSKEEGLNAYLNMIYNNYYSKGLNTPELMNPKYASSLEWAVAVNKYINKFKGV